MASYDAIVIGSGPNGLCAAITLARAGRSVLVREGGRTVGGSCRSAALTLPGFVHDVCSTVQALAVSSPVLKTIPLAEHGLEFAYPPAPVAQALDDGTAVVLERSVDRTADSLGADGPAYRRLMAPLAEHWDELSADLLGPLRVPRHPLRLSRFGLSAVRSARALAESWFDGQPARALIAGLAAHSIVPLEWAGSAAFGLVLGASAHAGGWPFARGGSQKLSDALASYFRSLGGTIETAAPVDNVDHLPRARAILCDLTPRQLLKIAGHRFPPGYRRALERFRYGPGVFKLDWALDSPIPWTAPGCTRAGTVHLGGTFDEIADAERAPWRGEHARRPYVLLVQQTPWDGDRAPAGSHTAWAYCHVPNGSTLDVTDRLEAQVERFAPGFRNHIQARATMNSAAMERHNPNLVGGDVGGGANTLRQLFARPVLRLNPYATPAKGLYICSASTPPGAGVHGMCGYWAARAALRQLLR
jgi:phytoene dehydrogenase-like protein